MNIPPGLVSIIEPDPLNVLLACSWSGGKDSCYALMRRLNQGGKLTVVLNMMNEFGEISRSHGLPISILEQQANRLGVPMLRRASSWGDYEHHFNAMLGQAKNDFNVQEVVFGDIDLQPHRDWEEMVCEKAELTARLPLWKEPRAELVKEMLAAGIEAYIVSCNSTLGSAFIGRRLDEAMIDELSALGVDPCGEEGEFHTVVTNCPLFSAPISFPPFRAVQHNEYWFAVFD